MIFVLSGSLYATGFSVTSRHAERNTALHLIPAQGPQLAAASAAALAKKPSSSSPIDERIISSPPPVADSLNEVSSLPGDNPSSDAASKGARDFVSGIFSLPSVIYRNAASVTNDGRNINTDDSNQDKVVLHSVLGFRWVKTVDGECRALPPPASSSSCNSILPNARDQMLHGWYSKGCKLGSLFSPDEDYSCQQTMN